MQFCSTTEVYGKCTIDECMYIDIMQLDRFQSITYYAPLHLSKQPGILLLLGHLPAFHCQTDFSYAYSIVD